MKTAYKHDNTCGMNNSVPGGVYLCQVNDTVSCGACCGLYNLAEISRPSLEERLLRRSRSFARIPRSVEAMEAYAATVQREEDRRSPLKEFHHCPFVGLIGESHTRVGCLLHPLGQGNRGIDFRGLSYYGGMACRSYFCPTVHSLAVRHKRIVRALAADWFTYGLVVTEQRLLEALFKRVEEGLGFGVSEAMFPQGSKAAAALDDLLGLKPAWPFRPAGSTALCHYFFKDNLYPRPAIDYRRPGAPSSRLDLILTELGSAFRNLEQLNAAEKLVNDKIQAVVDALAGRQQVPCGSKAH